MTKDQQLAYYMDENARLRTALEKADNRLAEAFRLILRQREGLGSPDCLWATEIRNFLIGGK